MSMTSLDKYPGFEIPPEIREAAQTLMDHTDYILENSPLTQDPPEVVHRVGELRISHGADVRCNWCLKEIKRTEKATTDS